MNTIDRLQYPAELAAKADGFRQTMAGLPLPEVEVFASEPEGFRMRAEFRFGMKTTAPTMQ